jgi:VWFA-related protein
VTMRHFRNKGRGLAGPGLILLLGAAALLGQDAAQVQRHESLVVNIEVPVRVLKKDAFVDGLTLADFEVFENGVRQDIEAVYLIKNRKILREERAPFASAPAPPKARVYVLSLDLKDYIPRIGDALDYFFVEVLGPEDSLFVVTPAKTYKFRSEYLARTPRQKIADRLKGLLKTDIALGSSNYRNKMRDFYQLAAEEFPPEMADVKENLLFEMAKEIRNLTELTEERVRAFADFMKEMEGEKHVFLIFQREVLPAHVFSDDRQTELFKPVTFDVDKIKRYFADASITVHSLYITRRPAVAARDMLAGGSVLASQLQDISADIYASFKEIAVATGGITESTTNPNFALRQAADASSNYYLLYYRPVDYRADGQFHEIKVKVRGEGLKVTHRLGYIAD